MNPLIGLTAQDSGNRFAFRAYALRGIFETHSETTNVMQASVLVHDGVGAIDTVCVMETYETVLEILTTAGISTYSSGSRKVG